MTTRIFALSLALLLQAGCATKFPIESKISQEVSGSLALYAVFASNAYPENIPIDGLEALDWRKVDIQGRRVAADRPSHSGFFTGLAFDIWENSKTLDSVISFRGTDSIWDWVTGNLAIPASPQYWSARSKVREYVAIAGNRNILATGHSLGGGLALSVSAQEDLNVDAIVFNSSPRVFDGLGNEPPKCRKRIQLFELGEALQSPRSVWSWKISELVSDENTFYSEYLEGGGFRKHGIRELAVQLICQGRYHSQSNRVLASNLDCDASIESLSD